MTSRIITAAEHGRSAQLRKRSKDFTRKGRGDDPRPFRLQYYILKDVAQCGPKWWLFFAQTVI